MQVIRMKVVTKTTEVAPMTGKTAQTIAMCGANDSDATEQFQEEESGGV